MTTAAAPAPTRFRLFRWKAIGPLLGFLVLLAILWWLFADRIAHETTEDVGTSVLGARVDLRRLRLDLTEGKVAINGLTVGSPFDAMRNLFEADELVANIQVLPLLEKKVVIDRIAATGLRFGTARTTPGFERGAGKTEEVKEEVRAFAERLDVPVLRLATGRIEETPLNPDSLTTVRVATALAARADSSRRAWEGALDSLRVGATVDSVEALLPRLRGRVDLALLSDARRTLDQVKRTRDQLTTLERGVTGGVAGLRAGLDSLAAAQQRDVATARNLLKLPILDAPNIGAALFGPVVVGRFQQALYYTQLARRYIPPGLLPREGPATRRVRRDGVDVRFPRERAYPGFLVREGELSFELGADSAPRTYAGRLEGLTSDPALYGRPTTFAASAPALRIGALVDHVRDVARDTAAATLGNVGLPAFNLPGLPLRLEPGRGEVTLAFALHGDNLRGSWRVRTDAARWRRDSAGSSQLEDLVGRVLQGINTLDLTAELRGTLQRPSLAVRSNLDEAIAGRLRALLGEELALVERRIRSQVDSLVEPQVAPIRARVTELTQQANQRLGEQKARLEAAQRSLEQRIREATRLPGIRLP
jgi:uncharacterized protein (TIGR03545 family)